MNYFADLVVPLRNFKEILVIMNSKGGRTFRAKDLNERQAMLNGWDLQKLCDLDLIRVVSRQKEMVKIKTGHERAYVVSHETGEVFDDLEKISKYEKDLYVMFDIGYKEVESEYLVYTLMVDNMADAQNIFIKDLEFAFRKVK